MGIRCCSLNAQVIPGAIDATKYSRAFGTSSLVGLKLFSAVFHSGDAPFGLVLPISGEGNKEPVCLGLVSEKIQGSGFALRETSRYSLGRDVYRHSSLETCEVVLASRILSKGS